MTLEEAKRIAFKAKAASTAKLQEAVIVIRNEGKGRDDMAYAKLAELAAEWRQGR